MRFIPIFLFLFLLANPEDCSICLQPLGNTFSIDSWGNAFHTDHENEGVFCHSCSRIISQTVTQGGYIYSDGRHLCSLCKITAVNDDSVIEISYQKVIAQFEKVGILHIPTNIPIKLVNLQQLNKKAREMSHIKLKGFTIIDPIVNNTNQLSNPYNISILFGLPEIEFEAVLAHELLHVWLHQNNITLSSQSTEGFCNLGSYLVYNNDDTHFSNNHLQAMANFKNTVYGEGYNKMKVQLEKLGWKKLISNL